ncbi:MAG: sigma-70 family RNA polymerase sigma factor [Acidobacteriota bacterium]
MNTAKRAIAALFMDPTDEQWLRDLRSSGERQQTALETLRSTLLRGLRAALAQRQLSPAVLEDAVQEALIKILDRLDSFEGRSRFTTWAMSIAVRAVWTEMRRRHWRGVSLEEVLAASGEPFEDRPSLESLPERRAERSALGARLRQAIHRDLTAKQRTALLAELAGMPQEEIARRMGSNRNALYKLVHDARKRLRGSLEASGISPADVLSAFE